MNDPYKVLNISSNASDDEVKRAYKEMSKKYHPDSYINNPLADLAEDKFKEVQEAYKEIMDMRANGGNSSGNRGTDNNTGCGLFLSGCSVYEVCCYSLLQYNAVSGYYRHTAYGTDPGRVRIHADKSDRKV